MSTICTSQPMPTDQATAKIQLNRPTMLPTNTSAPRRRILTSASITKVHMLPLVNFHASLSLRGRPIAAATATGINWYEITGAAKMNAIQTAVA